MYKLCNENSENEAQQWACGPDKQNNELKEAKQEHGAVGSSGDSTLWIDHLVREPFPVCFAVCDWYVDGDFYSFYLEQYIDSWANSLLVRITSVLQTCLLPCKCKLEKKNQRLFPECSKSKWKFQKAYSGTGSRSKGGSALLTAQAQRSPKDYTADCQWGVQSTGLRNQRIRVRGLWVSCPTGDNSNLLEGCIHTRIGELHVPPEHFIYSASSCKGLHHDLREQQENNALPPFCKYLLKAIINAVKNGKGRSTSCLQ